MKGLTLTVRGRTDSDSDTDVSLVDFNYDSKFMIEVRGLPWSATKQDVFDFFENVQILNGVNGIHFIVEKNSIRSGRAYIQLQNLNDMTLAMKYHKKCMGDRYIEGKIVV